MRKTLRLGTRGSQLALWQAHHVRDRLGELHPTLPVEIQIIKTEGDLSTRKSLSRFATKGVFVKELEAALLAEEIDLAVHSLKDVPTELPDPLLLPAILVREDPRDALVTSDGRAFDLLPKGALVGTSSPRRVSQLKGLRPDLEFKEIRGNLDTRIGKMRDGKYDAIVVAMAGLQRLKPEGALKSPMSLKDILPAPGQGALALECRASDRRVRKIVEGLHDEATAQCVGAERAVLAALGGGCQLPLGTHGTGGPGKRYRLSAVVADLNGRRVLRTDSSGGDPAEVAQRVAEQLKFLGAEKLLG